MAANLPNNIGRNQRFRYFALFLIVSPTSFINKTNSSRDLTIK